jgi:protein-S-isoprenylcysteine O-methyltransferase Ste14
MVALGNFIFHYRNGLFPLALLLVLLPGTRIYGNIFDTVAIGLSFALLGQAVRVVTIGYEYVIRGGRNRRVYAETLVTAGIYGIVRNPLYLGNLLILIGIAITSNSLTCLVIAMPLFVIAYKAIVAAEEDFLRSKFGEAYDQYATEVPRWFPRFSVLQDAIGNGTFHWRRVLIKEFGTPYGWMTIMVAICLYRLWLRYQLQRRAEGVRIMIGVWLILTILYLYVRYLKKSRRIVAD